MTAEIIHITDTGAPPAIFSPTAFVYRDPHSFRGANVYTPITISGSLHRQRLRPAGWENPPWTLPK